MITTTTLLLTLIPFALTFIVKSMLTKIEYTIDDERYTNFFEFINCFKCLNFWITLIFISIYTSNPLIGLMNATINTIIYFLITTKK